MLSPATAWRPRYFLGEDVANELVDWFNAVDLTYRTDLRELNELSFARFDAKLEQRLLRCAQNSVPRRISCARRSSIAGLPIALPRQ